MKRCLLLASIMVLAMVTFAQAEPKVISVSQIAAHPALDAVLKGFQDSLKEAGVEVKYNVRLAQGNQATNSQIAKQMVAEQPDLMMAITTPSAQACAMELKKAPQNMKRPFLFSAVTDPVAAGLVENLEKPGGMTTGVSDMLPVREHVKMILAFNPGIKKLGFFYNAGEANSKVLVPLMKELGKEMGFELVEVTAANTAAVSQAAKSFVGKVDAIYIPTDNTIISALESVIKVGLQNKLPVFAADVDSVKRGAIAAMGFDYYQHGIQTGAMAKRILDGAAPTTIPVEFHQKMELHINAGIAAKMGITPPQELLDKASKIYQ